MPETGRERVHPEKQQDPRQLKLVRLQVLFSFGLTLVVLGIPL